MRTQAMMRLIRCDRFLPQRSGQLGAVLLACVLTASGVMRVDTAAAAGSSEGPAVAKLGASLVIAGAPNEGAMRAAESAAHRASPAAVAARAASASAYANLSNSQAVALAKSAFPTTIDEAAGGPPKLPAGQHVIAFLSEHVAQIALASGESGLVASNAPIATPTSKGFAPVSLALQTHGAGFGVANSPTQVELPRRVSTGAQLPQLPGLSLTPVGADGSPLSGGEGVEDGASILYPNTGQDMDTAFKPTPTGADVLSLLRSSSSPSILHYAVGLPTGAALAQDPESEAIQISKEGAVVAEIPRPTARDASGEAVPTKTTVTGSTVTVSVTATAGEAQYPIAVDPELSLIGEYLIPALWKKEETPSGNYAADLTKIPMRLAHIGAFMGGDWGGLATQSQGESKIYAFILRVDLWPSFANSETGYQQSTYPYLEAFMALNSAPSWHLLLSGKPVPPQEQILCATPQCDGTGGTPGNAAIFELNTLESSTQYEAQGEYEKVAFGGQIENASVYYSQPSSLHSTVEYSKEPTIAYESVEHKHEVQPNVLYGAGRWVGPASEGALEFKSADKGLGVAGTAFETKHAGAWEVVGARSYFTEGIGCIGVLCDPNLAEALESKWLTSHLPNGEDAIRVSAHDEMAGSTSSEHEGEATVKVDSEKPHGIALSGLPSKAGVLELGETEAQITAEATDGQAGTPSSGIKSLTLAIDGKDIGKPSGSCTLGPCTATTHWTISGADLGVGLHTVKVLATDNANNYSEQEFKLHVSATSPLPLGPGSVNPESGDYATEVSDVDESGGLGALSVSRHYDSRNPTEGQTGPFGPQWTIDLASLASLEVLPDGSVLSIGPSGLTHFAHLEDGGYESPEGDKSLHLRAEENGNKEIIAYFLEDPTAGTSVKYTLPAGAERWMATVSDGPAATDTITAEYTTSEPEAGKKVVEPTLEVAPHPSATCTTKHLEKGCRALEFIYTTGSTSASGENRSQWGKYHGRLQQVVFVAYNPSTKAMSEKAVAQYEYDAKGRLRAEWNPSVSSTLKTTYGYDPEGHLTAIAPPGQQPWILSYGATAGSASTGDLLKVTRPPASTAFWNGEAVKNTEAPKLSGTPVMGNTLGVSAGKWSNTPATYSYQWMDCNASGGECVPISGAINANYTLQMSDVAHEVRAQVAATNADGTVIASVATATWVFLETSPVTAGTQYPTPAPGYTVDYGVPVSGTGAPHQLSAKEVEAWGQHDDPVYATAIFPPDEPEGWPAKDYRRATIDYFDSQGHAVNVASPSGGIATSEYNEENDVVRSISPDNRATALKEANPAEAAKRLDSESTYNEQGQLMESRGPQHMVRLAVGKEKAGEEVLARNHVKYHYDEGAPGGESYSLVTKVEDGAETTSGEEFDKRTTLTSYSGQEGLGWKLRKPTSTVVEPSGLDLIHKTSYDPNSGNVTETQSPGGNSEQVYPFAFSSVFGSTGSGNGQFNDPTGIATDASGNLWVADQNNGRIQKFSSSGAFIASYGTKGSGNLQFNEPWAVAINPSTGNVYVTDKMNNRVEELSGSGAYVSSFGTSGTGALHEPTGIAIDSSGNVWISDFGHNRLAEFSAEGGFIREAGSAGSGNGQLKGPAGLAISEGSVFVADSGNSRVEQFSSTGTYLGQFGSKGAGAGQFNEPYGLAANPSTGTLFVADPWNKRVEEYSPAGRFLTEWVTSGPTHEETSPFGLAVAANGKLYVTDVFGSKVSSWTPPEAGAARLSYSSQFGSAGSGNGQFAGAVSSSIDGEGNIWVTDYGNNRVEKFSTKGTFIAAYGSQGTGNGQFRGPGGIDVNQSTGNVYVSDSENHRIEELSSAGAFVRVFGSSGSGELKDPGALSIDSSGNVWVPDLTANRIVEFSSTGTFVAAYGSEGTGNGQFEKPTAVAFSGGNLYVADNHNHRIDELSPTGTFIRHFGIEGEGSGELLEPEGIAADAAGNLYVVDDHAGHVEEFTPSGGYYGTFATKGSGAGQLEEPIGDSIDAAGDLYVVDLGTGRVEKWSAMNPAVHHEQTIYYTAKGEASVAACQNHPEWVGLPCQTQPAAQPKTTGLPELPVTLITYNMWDQAESTIETFGTVTRTRVTSFDGGGRPLSTEETSSNDTALPKVSETYNSINGSLETKSTTVSGTTKTIATMENTLGELEIYTDADGNQAKYTYDEDGRTVSISDGSAEGKGKQTFSYDETTGALTKLIDSGAGTLTATYDAEGRMSSESYPNGMTAYYTYNAVGAATGLEYKKLTHCSEKCTWFSDTVVPSIHGEMLRQTSSFSEETYSDDSAGRLTEVQETPAGGGCTVRSYSYDEEGDRTSLTTRKPGAEGKCASEGGTSEPHVYDPAGRLADSGVTYEAFGNQTYLPSNDSGGGEGSEVTSNYYVDGQVFKQTQSGETHEYQLDPEDRSRETISSGKTAGTSITHYDAPGTTVAWTAESGSKWTRPINGIDGELAGVQTSPTTTVLLLHDLNGNVVATASTSETETKPLSTYNSTEFGVPKAGTTPPKYAWRGGLGVVTEQSSSGLITQDGATYLPLLGAPLQAPAELAAEEPLNAAIPFVATLSASVGEYMAGASAEGVAKREQENREREEALQPAGEVPSSEPADPHEWMMLSSHQVKTYANNIKGKASWTAIAHEVFDLIPKWGEQLGVGPQGIQAKYERWAYELEYCGAVAERCFVTVGYVVAPVVDRSFVVSVSVEPCYRAPENTGYYICGSEGYYRRENVYGKD